MTDAVIYVIDDDDAARQSLEFLLGSSELAVQSFDSAIKFLKKSLPISPCGCIVTDVLMPDVTGIDLIKLLIELNINIPVIVITGVGDVPLAVEAMKLGAVDYRPERVGPDRRARRSR